MADESVPPPLPPPVMDYEGELWPPLNELDPEIHPEMMAEQRLIRLEALIDRLIEKVPIDETLTGVYEPIMVFRPQGFTTREEFARQQKVIVAKRSLDDARENIRETS